MSLPQKAEIPDAVLWILSFRKAGGNKEEQRLVVIY